jgi:cobalt/nickel transport system permease protein
MHIPDGFLDPKISNGLIGASVGVLGYCLGKVFKSITSLVPARVLSAAGNSLGNIKLASRRVLNKFGEQQLLKMAMVGAWVFSAQMFNFPINSGTSGHLIGGVFASVILGPFAGTIVISVVLLIQSLFFADGGLMALGANIINMAIIGSFVSYYIYISLKKYTSEIISIAIASWFSVVLASFACALEIGLSGTIGLKDVIFAMLKVHSIIGICEAIITVVLWKLFCRTSL